MSQQPTNQSQRSEGARDASGHDDLSSLLSATQIVRAAQGYNLTAADRKLPISSTPTPLEWTSEKYDEELRNTPATLYADAQDGTVHHALNFLKIYAGATAGDEVILNTMRGLFAGIKYNGVPVFKVTPPSGANAPIVPSGDIQSPSPGAWKFFDTATKSSAVVEQAGYSYDSYKEAITTVEADIWYKGMTRALESGSGTTKANAALYVGYLAMVYVRSITKTPAQVAKYVLDRVYGRVVKLTSLDSGKIDANLKIHAVPPMNVENAKIVRDLLSKGSPHFKRVLLPIIEGYRHSDGEISGIFRSSCLLALSYTGLQLYTWWIRATVATGQETAQLMEFFEADRYKEYLRIILKFDILACRSNKASTWPYARLLKDDAWANYTVSNYKAPTLLCVALSVHGDDKAQEWNAESLNPINKEEREKACLTALTIYDKLAEEEINAVGAGAKYISLMKAVAAGRKVRDRDESDEDDCSGDLGI